MPDIIYIEQQIADHPQVARICQRFPNARRISCEHYGEIFNRKAQNFRLQKQRPALILAQKTGRLVLPAPAGYGVGGDHHYYFSHMLNCVYDCRYCFLQGMYRSAHYVVFVNYEDFQASIVDTLASHPDSQSWFYSGYDCDSLAYEPVTQFASEFLPFFRRHANAWLELRTKSPHSRALLKQTPVNNCIIAWSFTPEPISAALEHGVPSLDKRLAVIARLQQQGWRIGLRFDPLIYDPEFKPLYHALFEKIFSQLDGSTLHSVSLGGFRLPKPFYATMQRLYPDEALFAGAMHEQDGMLAYPAALAAELIDYCSTELQRYIPDSIFFPCHNDPAPASVATL